MSNYYLQEVVNLIKIKKNGKILFIKAPILRWTPKVYA